MALKLVQFLFLLHMLNNELPNSDILLNQLQLIWKTEINKWLSIHHVNNYCKQYMYKTHEKFNNSELKFEQNFLRIFYNQKIVCIIVFICIEGLDIKLPVIEWNFIKLPNLIYSVWNSVRSHAAVMYRNRY